jgi:hypothetical protein
MSAEQLLALLIQCQTNNLAQGITGMLLYGNETFLQAIEGEDAVIEALLDKINRDSRHSNIQVLSRKKIERRQYADWTMGFERVTDESLGEIEGLTDFGATDFTFDYLVDNQPVVASLMDHYREPHWNPLLGELDAKDKVIEHLKTSLATLRGKAQMVHLALESLTQASRDGQPSESLRRLCESALDGLRPR